MEKKVRTKKIYPATLIIELYYEHKYEIDTIKYTIRNKHELSQNLYKAIHRYGLYQKNYKAFVIFHHSKVNEAILKL